MSLRLHFFSNLLLIFLLGTAYLQARFYQPNCKPWGSYYVDYVIINQDEKKIILELENGSILVIPFDIGFKEFQITTGRGFEQTYIYDGTKLKRTEKRECVDSI